MSAKLAINPFSSIIRLKRRKKKFQIDLLHSGTYCRLCLKSNGQCGLFSINADSKYLLAEMFNFQKVDDWKVCVPCLNSIESAAKFKKNAKKSEKTMKKFLDGNIKMEDEIEEIIGENQETSLDTSETADIVVDYDLIEPEVTLETNAEESQSPKTANDQTLPTVMLPPPPPLKKKINKSKRKSGSWLFSSKPRTVHCIEANCRQMFSRNQDMMKHHKIIHLKIFPNKTNTKQIMPTQSSSQKNEETANGKQSTTKIELSPAEGTISAQEVAKKLSCPSCKGEFTLNELTVHIQACTGTGEVNCVQIKSEPIDIDMPEAQPSTRLTTCIPISSLMNSPIAETAMSYTCEICQAVFSYFSEMIEHRSSHDIENVPSQQVVRNEEQHHGNSKRQAAINARSSFIFGAYRCPHCPKAFDIKGLLARHLRIVHGIIVNVQKKRYYPKKKKKKATPAAKIVVTPDFVHEILEPELLQEDEQYDNDYDEEEDPMQDFTTGAANNFEPSSSSQNNETGGHHEEIPKIYIRFCCGLSFINRHQYSRHRIKQHPELIKKMPREECQYCMICHVRTESRSALLIHYKQAHEGERVSATCNVCGKQYAHSRPIYHHKRTMHPELFL